MALDDKVKEIRVNVILEGVEDRAYTTDFVYTKLNGDLMVRECVFRDKLTKPMPSKYEYI